MGSGSFRSKLACALLAPFPHVSIVFPTQPLHPAYADDSPSTIAIPGARVTDQVPTERGLCTRFNALACSSNLVNMNDTNSKQLLGLNFLWCLGLYLSWS